MKNISGKWPILAVILFGLFVVFGPYSDSKVSARDKNVYKEIKTFNEVLDLVQTNYVEEIAS